MKNNAARPNEYVLYFIKSVQPAAGIYSDSYRNPASLLKGFLIRNTIGYAERCFLTVSKAGLMKSRRPVRNFTHC